MCFDSLFWVWIPGAFSVLFIRSMSVTKCKVRSHRLIKLRLGLLEFMTIYPDSVHIRREKHVRLGTAHRTGDWCYLLSYSFSTQALAGGSLGPSFSNKSLKWIQDLQFLTASYIPHSASQIKLIVSFYFSFCQYFDLPL